MKNEQAGNVEWDVMKRDMEKEQPQVRIFSKDLWRTNIKDV